MGGLFFINFSIITSKYPKSLQFESYTDSCVINLILCRPKQDPEDCLDHLDLLGQLEKQVLLD